MNKKSAFDGVKNNPAIHHVQNFMKNQNSLYFFLRIQSNSEHISLNDIICRKKLIILIRKNTSINVVWHDKDVNIIQSKSSLLSIYDVSLYSPRNNGYNDLCLHWFYAGKMKWRWLPENNNRHAGTPWEGHRSHWTPQCICTCHKYLDPCKKSTWLKTVIS